MDYRLEFSDDAKHLTVTFVGAIDVRVAERFNRAVLEDERFRPGLTWLVDLSAAAQVPPSDETRERVATQVLERDWSRPPRAIAFVARDSEAARELELWRAQLGGSQSRRRVFTSRDEAEAWLKTLID